MRWEMCPFHWDVPTVWTLSEASLWEFIQTAPNQSLAGGSLEKGEQIHSVNREDLKWDGRDVRPWSHIWKDGMMRAVWKHKNVLWWRAFMRQLACVFELLWVLTPNLKCVQVCLTKWVLDSKNCSDLLIFDGRNSSVSPFMCDPLCILLGNTYGKAKKLHMVLLVSVCTENLQLGKICIFFLPCRPQGHSL